jgi:hypothetical protein
MIGYTLKGSKEIKIEIRLNFWSLSTEPATYRCSNNTQSKLAVDILKKSQFTEMQES